MVTGPIVLQPGPPALCSGSVVHRRTRPQVNAFAYPVSYAWFDPDHPDDLCRQHPLWSARFPAPVRFRRDDYGPPGDRRPLGTIARDRVADTLGHRPAGPVRMMTQLRRWGWLFNPITVYLVWDTGDDGALGVDAGHGPNPAAAVLEVTNTPWKQRVGYPLVLEERGHRLVSVFDKAMHVSPFVTMDHRYRLELVGDDNRLDLTIDVVDPDPEEASGAPPGGAIAPEGGAPSAPPILHTAMHLRRRIADRAALTRSLRRDGLATHAVSLGIHRQAARLAAKGVPFVPHPDRGRHLTHTRASVE